ncbi:hypothetical protein BP6252_11497 [Coleophoma cylindrospora]|uniref:Uncharacterized protein n=1 Tax=Coleophoma cylindrospora TaxID=1849047 RepID=A0A3D8QKU5_9HELO|nr:hypothetical protein BP6252_11497 [Coleophoma cylindrospora]
MFTASHTDAEKNLDCEPECKSPTSPSPTQAPGITQSVLKPEGPEDNSQDLCINLDPPTQPAKNNPEALQSTMASDLELMNEDRRECFPTLASPNRHVHFNNTPTTTVQEPIKLAAGNPALRPSLRKREFGIEIKITPDTEIQVADEVAAKLKYAAELVYRRDLRRFNKPRVMRGVRKGMRMPSIHPGNREMVGESFVDVEMGNDEEQGMQIQTRKIGENY